MINMFIVTSRASQWRLMITVFYTIMSGADSNNNNANNNNELCAPPYLTSFASAVRTCKYFHQAIDEEIKVDGKSPHETLHDIQFRVIRKIALQERAGILAWQGLDFEEIYAVAGCFWRNSILMGSGHMEL